MIRRVGNILLKEWIGMAKTPSSLLFGGVIPLLLVGQAIFLAWVLPRFLAPGTIPFGATAADGLTEVEQFRVLILAQFRFFVLLIPAMIANVFATLSIVEEKITRTLEPLLATPVRTWELLVGKTLSGAIPAVLLAWASAGLFVLLTGALGWGALLGHVLTLSWYLSLFLLTPTISILSFVLGVIGSSRASDAKSAQTLAVVVVLPLFALIAVQVTGLVWFTPLLTGIVAAGLAALDALMLALAGRLFARESIVMRWR